MTKLYSPYCLPALIELEALASSSILFLYNLSELTQNLFKLAAF